MTRPDRDRLAVVAVALLLSTASGPVLAAPPPVPGDDARRQGERIYRQGFLPSGEPVQAVVQEDIPVSGAMFTCVSCHLRSGLGNRGGRVIVPPTDGGHLYRVRPRADLWKRPRRPAGTPPGPPPAWESLPEALSGTDLRPAYTDETLAVALRKGEDPTGRKLDPLMPRYGLGDADMATLIAYLRELSSENSPGVSEDGIRFATVLCEDADPQVRDAFLETLKAYLIDFDKHIRRRAPRAPRAPLAGNEELGLARPVTLTVWELVGPRETWSAQLEEHYRQGPVFAILGGVSGGSWEPIHRFCEANQIPCLFPLTDLPVVSDSDWYTLYFSKGLYQEGEAAAQYLRGPLRVSEDAEVVQVYRKGEKARALARGFRDTWTGVGRPAPRDWILDGSTRVDDKVWSGVCAGDPKAVLLWVTPADIGSWQAPPGAGCRSAAVFASSGLLGEAGESVPVEARQTLYLTFPHSLPEDEQGKQARVDRWLRVRGVVSRDPRAEAKAYFLGWTLGAALLEVGSDLYRDYLLDTIDMMVDQTYAIAVYPRLSFGPGQRYAAKGCYVVQLAPENDSGVVPRSEWVIH